MTTPPDRRRYLEHLQSPLWSKLRRHVQLRAGSMCEGCGEKPMVDVHHLTYEHLGHEFLWELRGVCRECHERLHGIARANDGSG